jgi:hypothetical protein
LEIDSVQLADTGTYDVVASNPAASATSNSINLQVLSPVAITRQPLSSLPLPGSTVTLSVDATGSPPFSYQWYKNGVAISGANQPAYTIGSMRTDSEGAYRVDIQNAISSATSNIAVLQSSRSRGIFLLNQPTSVSFVQQTQATATFTLEPIHQRVIYDRCQIYTYENGQGRVPLGSLVSVPFNGQLKLPLQQILRSGTYTVRFTRLYSDGQYFSNESPPFEVFVVPWEKLAGRYEALLERASTSEFDCAKRSGMVSIYVNSRGVFSGRIVYDEAEEVEPLDTTSEKYKYSSVSRSMFGAFAADNSLPTTLRFKASIPSRSLGIMQDVDLVLDYGGTQPTMRATFKDHASISVQDSTDGLVSTSAGATRCLQYIPAALYPAVSRYSICASPSTEGGAVFVNTLTRDARMLWVSRARHGTGSGASSLQLEDNTTLKAVIFQRSSSTAGLTTATGSMMGHLTIAKTDDTNWNAWFGEDANPSLEQHFSVVEYSNSVSRLPAITHSSHIRALHFTEAQSTRWGSLMERQLLQTSPQALKLFIQEPALGQNELLPEKEWRLMPTINGAFFAIPVNSAEPTNIQQVRITFNARNGTFLGSYKPYDQPSQAMVGAIVSSAEKPELHAQGWIEPPSNFTKPCAIWRIEHIP